MRTDNVYGNFFKSSIIFERTSDPLYIQLWGVRIRTAWYSYYLILMYLVYITGIMTHLIHKNLYIPEYLHSIIWS